MRCYFQQCNDKYSRYFQFAWITPRTDACMHACMHMCSEQCVTFWSSEEFLFSFTRKLARSISSHLCVLTKFQFDHVFFSGLFQWNYCASKYCVWISLQPNWSLRIFSKRINHISYVLWPYSSLLILGMIGNYNQNERDKKNRLSFELESLNHMRECLCFRRNSFFPIFTS